MKPSEIIAQSLQQLAAGIREKEHELWQAEAAYKKLADAYREALLNENPIPDKPF